MIPVTQNSTKMQTNHSGEWLERDRVGSRSLSWPQGAWKVMNGFTVFLVMMAYSYTYIYISHTSYTYTSYTYTYIVKLTKM